VSKTFNPDELIFIPLGGSEQFGVNLNVYGYQGQWLVVDCGIGFPDTRMPGVDILLPNPAFLEERKKNIAGMIITHAHEDHVGAVPYLWPRLRCPLYCTAFTATVLQQNLEDAPNCKDAEITVIEPGQELDLGPFKNTFVPVAHSIPETCAVKIETQAGKVLHSADWNLDPKPVVGSRTEQKTFEKIGQEGIDAYVGDSTNAEVEGVSPSESDVEKGLEAVFSRCEGQIAITIFASNIGRIRSICKAAQAEGRNVAIVGRSLHKMTGAARVCGYLDDIPDFVVEEDINLIPKDKIVMIVTGSQGEARAQLARIARADHPEISLGRGDTVIYSSRAIPGNEKEIIAVNNNLAASGVEIITPGSAEETIHVSGHPRRGEITRMLDWLKPQSVVAVHGERTMIEAHAQLARACGIKTAIVPNNGSVIRIAPGPAEVLDHIETGLLAVEPGRIIDADHQAIIQRRKLQYSGTVHVSLVMNARGDLEADPQISTVGLIDPDTKEGQKFEDDIAGEIEDILTDLSRKERIDDDFVAEEIRIGVRRFVQHMLQIKPKTTVHLVRI